MPHWRLTRIRRRVFWLFIAAYAIVMPYLLLFAFGISYANGGAPVPTGSFAVSTSPAGARVSFQGRKSQTTPAVFDSLRPGTYSFSISAGNATTWTGSVQPSAELVSSIADLRMLPLSAPHTIISFEARREPLWIQEDAEAAWIPPGAGTVATARRAGLFEVTDRVSLPALDEHPDAALQWLDLSGQLVAVWRLGDRAYLTVVQNGHGSTLIRHPAAALPIPESTIAIVSLSADDKTVTVIDMAGVGRYTSGGRRTSLVKMSSPLFAYGYLRGRWYLMDRGGEVYQYGNPLSFWEIHHVDVKRYGLTGSWPVMTILAVSSDAVICRLGAEASLHVFTAEAGADFVGFAGGAAQKSGDAAWVWGDTGLFRTQKRQQPEEEARFTDRVLAVDDEFWPHISAVRTETTLFVLPKTVPMEGVRFDPLPLFQSESGTELLDASGGLLLLKRNSVADGSTYEILGWQQ